MCARHPLFCMLCSMQSHGQVEPDHPVGADWCPPVVCIVGPREGGIGWFAVTGQVSALAQVCLVGKSEGGFLVPQSNHP